MERHLTETECEITIPVSELLHNSLNIVHGGVTATLLDSAMGSMANSVLPEGYGAVTANLNIHYTAPGIGGQLAAEGRVVHKGTKMIVVEGEVIREDGRKIAHATGSFFIIKAKHKNE